MVAGRPRFLRPGRRVTYRRPVLARLALRFAAMSNATPLPRSPRLRWTPGQAGRSRGRVRPRRWRSCSSSSSRHRPRRGRAVEREAQDLLPVLGGRPTGRHGVTDIYSDQARHDSDQQIQAEAVASKWVERAVRCPSDGRAGDLLDAVPLRPVRHGVDGQLRRRLEPPGRRSASCPAGARSSRSPSRRPVVAGDARGRGDHRRHVPGALLGHPDRQRRPRSRSGFWRCSSSSGRAGGHGAATSRLGSPSAWRSPSSRTWRWWPPCWSRCG